MLKATHSVIVSRCLQVSTCSSMLLFSSCIRLRRISICSPKAPISCAHKVFITGPLCASEPWCLSTAQEDISDLKLGQVNFCQVLNKLRWDHATQSPCYKVFISHVTRCSFVGLCSILRSLEVNHVLKKSDLPL